jgi:hypothetical protein
MSVESIDRKDSLKTTKTCQIQNKLFVASVYLWFSIFEISRPLIVINLDPSSVSCRALWWFQLTSEFSLVVEQ